MVCLQSCFFLLLKTESSSLLSLISWRDLQVEKINALVLLKKLKQEDHWSCITHLSAEDMLKSVYIEERKFKHSPNVGVDNPLGPNF